MFIYFKSKVHAKNTPRNKQKTQGVLLPVYHHTELQQTKS